VAKRPLTKEQILQAEKALKEAFDAIAAIRRKHGVVGSLVQLPKIPPLFSESIVYRILDDQKLFSKLRFRNEGRDIIGLGPKGERTLIEVKSTGSNAFQYFSRKDIESDWLIWVHFGHHFEGAKGTITVYLLRDIRNQFPTPRKIHLKTVLEAVLPEQMDILAKGGDVEELLSRDPISQIRLDGYLK